MKSSFIFNIIVLLLLAVIFNQSYYVNMLAFAAPTVTSVTNNMSTLTITGTDFGGDISVVTINFPNQSVASYSPTTLQDQTVLTLTLQSGQNILNGDLIVVVGGVSSPSFPFKLTPFISNSNTAPSINGGLAYFNGTFLNKFRADGSLTTITLKIGTTIITPSDITVGSLGTTLNITTLPSGVGVVTSYLSIDSVEVSFPMAYIRPVIQVLVQSVNIIAIQAQNTGTQKSLVSLNSVNYNFSFPATSISGTTIYFTAADNSLTDYFYLTVNGLNSSNRQYAIFKPYLESATQIPTTGGVLSISGYFFTNPTKPTSVTFNGAICPLLSAAPRLIQCMAPAGVGNNNLVKVTVGETSQIYVSYYYPIINYIEQRGPYLNIIGQYFGPSSSASVTIGGVAGATVITVNSAQTNLTIMPTSDSKNGVVIAFASNLFSNEFPFTLQPVISSVTPTNTVGGLATIVGRFFGELRQNGSIAPVTASINGSPLTIISNTVNQTLCNIVVNIPAGTGKNFPVVVSVDNVASTPIFFSYNPPVISSLVQNGNMLTIVGSNFGTSSSAILPIVNDNLILSISNSNDTFISFELDPREKNGYVSVYVSGQLPISNASLELVPVITSTGPPLSLYGGSLTLTGQFINDKDYLGNTVNVLVSLLGRLCANPITSGTSLTCQYPDGLGGDVSVILKVGNHQTTKTASFPSPLIYSISPTQNVTDDTVTVYGSNFGTNIEQSLVQVDSDSKPYVAVAYLYNTSLIFIVPSDIVPGPISVIIFGKFSNTKPLMITPVMKSIQNVATVGSTASIIGKHFTKVSPASILLDNSPSSLSNIVVVNNTLITFTLPPGTGIGHLLVLSIDGLTSSLILNYPPPVITNAQQEYDGSHFTTVLTISGSSFGSSAQNVQVYFKNQPNIQFGTITSVVDGTIILNLPKFAKNDYIIVNVSGQSSNPFNYHIKPILKSITSADSTGGEINIGGLYLNTQNATGSPLAISVNFPNNVPCTNVQKIQDDQEMSHITCIAPPGNGINNVVSVTVGQYSDSINFSYGAPVLFSIKNECNNDTNVVSVIGKNFGSSQSEVKVYLNNATTPTFQLVNSSLITFNASSTVKNSLLTINLLDGRTSNPLPLYLIPIINSVSKNIKTTGDTLTIVGSYLNGKKMDGTSTNITIVLDGNTPCTNAVGNGTSISCNSPPGSGSNHYATVYIDNQPSSSNVPFSYMSPDITSIVQQEYTDTVLIYGSNFGIDLSKISIFNNIAVESFNESVITATLGRNSKNGLINVVVDGLTSNSFSLKIKSSISSISPASPYGGVVQLVGKYLWTTRMDSSSTDITVTIGGRPCTNITSPLGDGTSIECIIGNLSVHNQPVSLSIDSVSGNTSLVTYSSKSPVITTIIPTYYLVPGVITIQGEEFYEPIYVEIGGVECTNPHLIDQATITCQFDSSIGDNSSVKLSVFLESGALDITNDGKFSYMVLDCLNSCSSHGTCINSGQCQCNSGFTGADCSIPSIKSLPASVSDTPSGGSFVEYNNTVQFILSHLLELDENGTVVNSISLLSSKWDVLNQNGTTTTYNTSAGDNDKYNIVLNVTSYPNNAIVSFAGDDIVIPSNSIKHNILVEYKNSSSINSDVSSLAVIYKFTSQGQIEFECETVDTKYLFDSSSSSSMIKSYSIDSPLGTMMASFSNRAIIDGKNSIVSSIQPISTVDSSTQSSVGVQFVSIQVPLFQNSIQIDPVFSASSKTAPKDQDCNPIVSLSSTLETRITGVIFLILSFIFMI